MGGKLGFASPPGLEGGEGGGSAGGEEADLAGGLLRQAEAFDQNGIHIELQERVLQQQPELDGGPRCHFTVDAFLWLEACPIGLHGTQFSSTPPIQQNGYPRVLGALDEEAPAS